MDLVPFSVLLSNCVIVLIMIVVFSLLLDNIQLLTDSLLLIL